MNNPYNLFDLHEFVTEIESPEVAAQVAQSTAWRIDTLIVQAARQLYKAAKEQALCSLDENAEAINALNEMAFAEANFEAIGSDRIGPVTTIKILSGQRAEWHALASELTALTSDWQGVPRRYVEKSIDEQILEPGQFRVTAETKSKLHKGAVRIAEAMELGAEEAQHLFKRRLERQQSKLDDVSANLKEQAQGVAHMYHLAAHAKLDCDVDVNFWELPTKTRAILINNAIAAAQRAEEWAATDRNCTDSNYDLICVSSMKVVKELRMQLRHSAYTRAEITA